MLLRLQRLATARVMAGTGGRVWLILGTAAWLLRTANRVRKPTPEIVYRSALKPGERIQIDHLAVDQTGRPIRRKDRKQRKRR
jgi:hypothetical protein